MAYSIFRKKSNPEMFYRAYDETMKLWTVPFEDRMVNTRFGETHVVACGPVDARFISNSFKPDQKAEILLHQFLISGMNCVPQLRVIPSVFSDSELQNVSTQTLIMVGDEEVIYDHKAMISRAERLFQNVETHVVPHTGHALPVEQPRLVNETVMNFLAQ